MATPVPPSFRATDFNTGIFTCFDDMDSCLDGWACPWCHVSSQYNMLEHNEFGSLPWVYVPLIFLDWASGSLVLSCVGAAMRSIARRKLGLTQESDLHSFVKGFCCTPCSICQVYREMSMRGQWPGGICVGKRYVHPTLVVPPSIQTMGAGHAVELDAIQPIVYGYPLGVAQPPAVTYQHREDSTIDMRQSVAAPAPAAAPYPQPVLTQPPQHASAPPSIMHPVYGYEGQQPQPPPSKTVP